MTATLQERVAHDFAQPSLLSRLGLEWIDEMFYPLLKEKRDVVFIHWTIFLSALMLPLAALVVFNFKWYFVVLYYVCYLRFLGSYIIMLHCCCHSPIYKQHWMDQYLTCVLGVFFGQTPYTYYMHHIKMHHVEGNAEKDLSCTMPYQRDSFVGFLHYYFRFLIFGIFELLWYFIKKAQYKYALMAVSGEISYHSVGLWLMFYYDFKVGLFLYLLPINLTRFFMMSGNWAQHAFLAHDDPYNDYKNSITCIETPYNVWAFNDGYHASHHLHPKRHWTIHPTHFLETEKLYHANQAVVFRQLDYLAVWFKLMTQNYASLADYYVQLNGENKSKEEIMAMLKDKVRRFEPKKQQ